MSERLQYDAKVIVAYLTTLLDKDPDTREYWINRVLCEPNDIKTYYRWKTLTKRVDLSAIDAFLMRHDLMLWEFELWAEEQGLSPFAPPPEPRQRKPRARSRSRRPSSRRRTATPQGL